MEPQSSGACPKAEAPMFNALSDFLIFCRVERRLADLTCKAYDRDVRACLEFLRGDGIAALAEIRTPDLRRFLAQEATHRPAPSSQPSLPTSCETLMAEELLSPEGE